MRTWLPCFLLVVAVSCSSNSKDKFIKQTLISRRQKPGQLLLDYTVLQELNRDEVTVMELNVKVQKAGQESVIADSIIYTVTGDDVYLAQ